MLFPTNWKNQIRDNSRFRRFMAQLIAATSANWLILDLGICSFIPGIIIPALSAGIQNKHNVGETLSLSPDEASWLGSIGNIVAPVGCILACFITDLIGRKRTMMLSNIPLFTAWITLYRATSNIEIFIANILLGFSSGLIEAPVISYVGEIGEPEFRNFLMAYTYIGMTFGSLFVSVLNTLMPWRMVAFVCIFVPISSTALLCFVPESPIWLLSADRSQEALNALRWLRGWVSDGAAIEEFHSLQQYNERTKSCVPCIKRQLICKHPPATIMEKLAQLKRQQSLKPLAIVLALIFIFQVTRIFAIRPFIVQIFSAYKTPLQPDQSAAVLNFLNILANFVFLFVTAVMGKRRLYLIMLTIAFLCALITAGYGFAFLPYGFNSFTVPITYTLHEKWLPFIPFVCILIGSFCTCCGISSAPSQIMSELLTFKIRGIVTGLVSLVSNVLGFVFTKEYYALETSLTLPGVTLLTAVMLGLGLFTMYNIMPETKNRTNQDIEIHYADNSKKITNRKIPKNISVIELP